MRKKFNASAPYTNIDKLKNGGIVHIPTGLKITKEQMMDAIASARVIYVSEQHDNAAAHEAQLDVIKGLYKKHPGKIAVGMEMFRRSVQPQLDGLQKNALSLEDFNKLFDQQWSPNWRDVYQPILDYLHEKSISTIGLKPTKETEDIVRDGKINKSVPEMDMKDEYHKARYLSFFNKNGIPPAIAENRYKMMVLWDEAMAATVAEFLSNPDNDDKKLIVIAGGGHIDYGLGIPKRAFRRVPHNYSIVSPTTGNGLEDDMPLSLGDYAWKISANKAVQKPALKKDSKPKF